MPTFRPPCSLLPILTAAVVLAACSGEAPANETSAGSLLLQLELAAGVEISEVRWEISGGDMEPMAGVIDTSAPGATASVEVFGLRPGQGYLVALEAMTIDPEVACGGDAFFDVEAGASTEVMVMLNCKPPERFGGVRVNGELNVCPELTKVVVSPLQTSIGDEITLSATAFDPEGDPITFFWFGGGGEIADSSAPSTTYTCERVGEHVIYVGIRDDSFACIDQYWSVEVKCVHGDPAFEMCAPPERQCSDSGLFPTRPCCEHSVPQQQNACAGDESLSNPTSCTPTGNELTHTLTRLELAPSCHLGYDLDSCDGATCMVGGLTPGEGTDGVDNALTGIGPVLSGVGADLSDLDQALSDGLCGLTKSIQGQQCAAAITPTEVQLVVDANLEERCANVRVLSSGVEASQVILNLGQPTQSGTVCASGALGTVPLHLLGAPAAVDNAVVRMTMSDEGFSNGVMGATIDSDDAVAFAEVILPGLGAVLGQVFDVNGDLTQDTSSRCNALSTAFLIGGRTGTVIDPGSPVIPYDRTDGTTLAPFPDDYYLWEDPSTATGYRYSGPIPVGEVDVQVLYSALSAEARLVDGFRRDPGKRDLRKPRPLQAERPVKSAGSSAHRPFLGALPLDPALSQRTLRIGGDAGRADSGRQTARTVAVHDGGARARADESRLAADRGGRHRARHSLHDPQHGRHHTQAALDEGADPRPAAAKLHGRERRSGFRQRCRRRARDLGGAQLARGSILHRQ
ncbi:MAG: hypothetical protein JRE45_18935 [Deltaproteobacteria bacterium]|nr:hypothetical protein [Deltaproteobacteria bacterium]